MLEAITGAAENKKALEIKVLKLGRISRIADFLVICSGESSVQLRAIADEVEKKAREAGVKGCRWEGEPVSGWLILDTGNIIAHVMTPEMRERYDLEELWEAESVVYHY